MSDPANSECVRAVVREIEAAGLSAQVEHRAKHMAVVWDQADGRKTYIVPATTSDRRAWLNARADVRRMLRGATEIEPVVVAGAPRIIEGDGEILASSRTVAAEFDKRHDHVLRDIDNLLNNIDSPNLGSALFRPAMEPDAGGVMRRVYHMTKDGFALVAVGFSGPRAIKFKLAFIQAFNAMEGAMRDQRERAISLAASHDVRRLEGELGALTDLVLEIGSQRREAPRRRVIIKPSERMRARREARA